MPFPNIFWCDKRMDPSSRATFLWNGSIQVRIHAPCPQVLIFHGPIPRNFVTTLQTCDNLLTSYHQTESAVKIGQRSIDHFYPLNYEDKDSIYSIRSQVICFFIWVSEFYMHFSTFIVQITSQLLKILIRTMKTNCYFYFFCRKKKCLIPACPLCIYSHDIVFYRATTNLGIRSFPPTFFWSASPSLVLQVPYRQSSCPKIYCINNIYTYRY